jgi:PAS domain S-box-containing protein
MHADGKMTGRKEMEEALQQAEQKYRDIFENATEGIFQIGRDGRFLSGNPALARLHDYDSPAAMTEMVKHVQDDLFVDPEDHSELIRLLKEHDRVQNFEVRMKRRDGSIHWISINVRTVRDEKGRVLFHEGTMRSIAKRREAEQALAESEERYRTVIENSNDGIAMSSKGTHIYVNPRFVEMFGYDSPDEIVNKPITVIIHPDDRERVTSIHLRRWKAQPVPPRYEFKGMRKDGSIIHVEVSATSTTYRNQPVLLVFLRDITERKRAEELLLQSHRELEQLNRAKTKAVNHVAHELKTPLAVIQGNIRLLQRKLHGSPLDEQLRVIIGTMERNLERLLHMQKETDKIFRTTRELEASELVDELDRIKERMSDLSEMDPDLVTCLDTLKQWAGSHAPGSTVPFQPLDIYPFILQAVEKAKQHAVHRNVDLRLDGVHDLYILMDPAILRDVIEGLIRNAVENTPDGGFVLVALEEKEDAVLVHVSDSGIGIREENQQYIFDGLFHAKETELYASKRPYDFGAGGKGLDLLRMKVYAERFGFDLSMKSRRCPHIPADTDLCPGNIANCPHCGTSQNCFESGGTTFTVSFMKKR